MDTLLAGRAGIARYFTYVVTKAVKSGGRRPSPSCWITEAVKIAGIPPFAELLGDPSA